MKYALIIFIMCVVDKHEICSDNFCVLTNLVKFDVIIFMFVDKSHEIRCDLFFKFVEKSHRICSDIFYYVC